MARIAEIDRAILAHLRRNGRMSCVELAKDIGASEKTIRTHMKKMEENGIIRRQVALLEQEKLGLNLSAIIGISMDRHTPDRFENFERAIKDLPEIIECSIVTGQQADYLLKAVLPDMAHYEAFLLGKLTKIEGVTGVHSSFVLRKVIDKTALPLKHLA